MINRLLTFLVLVTLGQLCWGEQNQITTLALEENESKTVLTINLAASSGYDKKILDGGKLNLIIPECSVVKQTVTGGKDSAVSVIAANNNGKNAELTISFSPLAQSYRGYATVTPPRVVFEITKKPPEAVIEPKKETDPTKDKPKNPTPKNVTTGAVDLTPVLADTTSEPPSTTATPTKANSAGDKSVTSTTAAASNKNNGAIRRIVIDPGHGGPYGGCAGVTSDVGEKEVTLKIAYKLKKKLEDKLGLKVYMTRRDDSNILMRERTGLANRVKGDLFISIHLNAADSGKAHGTEVYFLSEARSDDERAIATLENADFEAEMEDMVKGSGLNFILGSMAQNEFLTQSSELAELVQTNLVKKLDTMDRGVKQAPFYVLMYTYMPSILVEVGFLSNKDEEKHLLDPAFQDKAADALYDAISAYKRTYEKKLGITPDTPKSTDSTKSSKKSGKTTKK